MKRSSVRGPMRYRDLAAGGILCGLLATLLPQLIALPGSDVNAPPVQAPVASVLALVISATIAVVAPEVSEELAATAVCVARARSMLRICLCLTVGWVAVSIAASEYVMAAMNSSLALSGEMLLLGSFVGVWPAWLFAASHALGSLLFGAQGRDSVAWWAWILEQNPAPSQILFSALLFFIAMLSWRRRLSRPYYLQRVG